jgi:hypothetical protein
MFIQKKRVFPNNVIKITMASQCLFNAVSKLNVEIQVPFLLLHGFLYQTLSLSGIAQF